VTLGAVFDEAGFEGGFYTGDAALVDIGLFLLFRGGLDIEIVERLAIDNGHAQLFTLSCVNQHTLHFSILARSTASASLFRARRKAAASVRRKPWARLRVRGSALYSAGATIRA